MVTPTFSVDELCVCLLFLSINMLPFTNLPLGAHGHTLLKACDSFLLLLVVDEMDFQSEVTKVQPEQMIRTYWVEQNDMNRWVYNHSR